MKKIILCIILAGFFNYALASEPRIIDINFPASLPRVRSIELHLDQHISVRQLLHELRDAVEQRYQVNPNHLGPLIVNRGGHILRDEDMLDTARDDFKVFEVLMVRGGDSPPPAHHRQVQDMEIG